MSSSSVSCIMVMMFRLSPLAHIVPSLCVGTGRARCSYCRLLRRRRWHEHRRSLDGDAHSPGR
jgi:hypothetical protein